MTIQYKNQGFSLTTSNLTTVLTINVTLSWHSKKY
jgi:hypothetical protein